MKSRLEKVSAGIVVIICLCGVILSFQKPESYSVLFEQVRGPLHVLTLIGLALGAFIFFYRSRVLRPFRPSTFLILLQVQGSLIVIAAFEQIFWATGLERSPFFQFCLFLSFLYFTLTPLLFSRMAVVSKFFNRFALASPRWAHTILYYGLVVLGLGVKGNYSLEMIEFAGVWLFVLVVYSPMNKRMFSRVSLTR